MTRLRGGVLRGGVFAAACAWPRRDGWILLAMIWPARMCCG
jgi:hypothetical protein